MSLFRRLIAAAAVACLAAQPVLADTVPFTLLSSAGWQDIAPAGQTIDVQVINVINGGQVFVTTSTGIPATADGQLLAKGDHRCWTLDKDLYALNSAPVALPVAQAKIEVSPVKSCGAGGPPSGSSSAVTNAGTFAVQNTAATPAGTNVIGSIANAAFGITGPLPALVAGTAHIGSVNIDNLPATGSSFTTPLYAIVGNPAGAFDAGNPLFASLVGTLLPAFASPPAVIQPDVTGAGTIAAATANAAYTVPLGNGEGVVGFKVSGLTGSGATLMAEGSNDGGMTWSAVNTVAPATNAISPTVTADSQFRVNAGGHTNVRLRVSTAGTGGSIAVAYTASSQNPLVALSAPASIQGSPGTITQTETPVPAATSTAITVLTARKFLRMTNDGASPCRVSYGVAATATNGEPLNGAGSNNVYGQGGGLSFDASFVPQATVFAYCSAASSFAVVEGQ